MTTTQRISFTALPNGVASSTPPRLKLSVFVSARYETDPLTETKLDLHTSFPQFADWPAMKPTFGVRFNGGPEVSATPVSAAPRSDLWAMLFPGNTYLRPHDFDETLATLSLATYSVKDVHVGLKSIYTYFAKNNPSDFPTVEELLGADSPLRDIAGNSMPLNLQSVPAIRGPGILAAPLVTTTPAKAEEFKKVEAFHQPFNSNRVTVTPPDVEFHGMLSALGRYPVLMRMLGLVYDLEVDAPTPLGDATVEVVAHFAVGSAIVPRVITNCHISATKFYARPRDTDPELSDDGLGMLPLEDPTKFDVVQVNHDGAALKTLRFSESVVRAHFDPTSQLFIDLVPAISGFTVSMDTTGKQYKTDDTPNEYSLPALGTAGIAVARAQRADAVKTALKTASTKNEDLKTGTVEVDAEDLTRGYAIDVYDSESQAWHSLCERVGTYRFSETTLSGIADEGWVGIGMTGASDGSNPASKKLQETLFNYWGWSLVAPRPGKTMDENGTPVYTQNDPTTQFDLKVEFVAKPGSLPKLRFGTTYNLRARAVDLAGNSTPRGAVTDKTHATPDVIYGRFEPVASPEVVLDKPLGEGDSRDRIVIRSNYDTGITTAAIRHIAPPKAAEPMIEALGSFDSASGFDPKAYKLLEQKDGGSWTDIGKPDPNYPGVFYVTEESNRILPYLPDVLSRGALFRGLPGSGAPLRVSFGYDSGQTWPNAQPFDLVLGEGSGAPSFNKGARNLNVQLAKGDVVETRLNSYIATSDVLQMALLEWMKTSPDMLPADVDAFLSHVNDGIHWMVTPFRTLTLVHAVRQPLLRPAFDKTTFIIDRAAGDTFATLTDPNFVISRKSTSRLDVIAQWSETIDTDASGPKVVQGNAKPIQLKVELDPPNETKLNINAAKHEFHDTKYRHVKYTADATSRFAEYFAERKTKVQVHAGQSILLHAPVTTEGTNWGGVVEFSEVVTAADRTKKYVRGVDYTMDYGLGRFTALQGLDGQMVTIVYTATPIARRTEVVREMDVPSSARPAAPKVLYLVPTFGWSSSTNQSLTDYKSERRGGGLRAYLDRPWFSSGDGEMLGVVIWTGAWPPDETTKMYVSDWGLDPMYKSAATTERPLVTAFKTATADTSTQFTLQELKADEHHFHVAAHAVAYDASRKLWYADIEIDAGPSYFPFVRLALARYQPHSVPGVHLSRVVLADFVQLTANRAASLTRPSKQSDTLTVAVSGLSYQLLDSSTGPSTVEVSLERRRANTEPDKQAELAWEQVPASTAALAASPGPNGTTMWTGQVTLPKNMGDRFRVVIQEFEKFGTDRRLVYADAIEVDR